MHEFAKNTSVQLTFDLNFQPLTDRLSDVQKVKSKHLSGNHALNSPVGKQQKHMIYRKGRIYWRGILPTWLCDMIYLQLTTTTF